MVRPGQGMDGEGVEVIGAYAGCPEGCPRVRSSVFGATECHSNSAKAICSRAEAAATAGICAGAATGSACADDQASRS